MILPHLPVSRETTSVVPTVVTLRVGDRKSPANEPHLQEALEGEDACGEQGLKPSKTLQQAGRRSLQQDL